MKNTLSKSALKVQMALTSKGLSLQVVELPASTRTAREAAAAVGCKVEQIAKSLIFKGEITDQPVLIIAGGKNRVDERMIKGLINEPIVKADAEFVRQHTGFAIGGIPPVGHDRPIRTIIDEDLLKLDSIWAAAGTPNAVFRLHPDDLLKITDGIVASIG